MKTLTSLLLNSKLNCCKFINKFNLLLLFYLLDGFFEFYYISYKTCGNDNNDDSDARGVNCISFCPHK